MNRLSAIVAVVGLLVGVLAGYLWWGVGAQSQLSAAQGQILVVQSELKATQEKIKAMEAELRLERDRRAKLEEIVTRGRK